MHPMLQQTADAIERATNGLSDAQMEQHPEGKWSIGNILEHLSLAFSSTTRVMSKCIAGGRPLTTKGNFRNLVARLLVIRFSFIPNGRKAPRVVVPKGIPASQARLAILDNLRQMDDILTQCEDRFGRSVKVADHAILGPIPIWEWRKFHLQHTLHHMKQVAQLAATYSQTSARQSPDKRAAQSGMK